MSDENYLCSVCGASFLSFLLFKRHVEIKHPDNLYELELDSPLTKNPIDLYSCHVCARIFRHKKLLRRHIRLEHGCTTGETRSVKIEVEEQVLTEDHTYMDHAVKYERDEFLEESEYVCGNCGGIFSTLFNLRKHVRAKHPGLLDTLAPRKKIGSFACDECGKKFSHRKSLGRHKIGKHKSSPELKECVECGKPFLNLVNFHKHMKTKHPGSSATLVLQGIKEGEFECDTCGKQFSQRKNLRRHVLDKHKEASAYYTGKSVAVYQCPLCSFNKSGDVSLIINHFRLDHRIRVDTKEEVFDSKESFVKWKDDLERTTKSSYIKKAHVGATSYFRCHRSGKYRPRGKGIRNLKVQGTNKIGGFCPAGMQVRITDDKYFVRYSETHVGHTNDLKHLSLSVRERQNLATKIAAQVSLDDILTNVRKTAGSTEDELARVSLVTKQDLANIVRQYQLEGTAVRHAVTPDSLDTWLNNSRPNIMYYKPQNCPDPEHPQLLAQDFVLIIMTETQRDVLIRFGGGCVCLDRTYVSPGRLHLSTVSVVDGLRSGFPVALLISNRQDCETLEFFFTTVRQTVGEITPGLLLTDVAEDYHSAWVRIMGDPGQTLFCLWQVERDWRDNLATLVFESKQGDTFYRLRSLLIEKNSQTFHRGLSDICEELTLDPYLGTFAKYFKDNYSENYQYWSSAYRPSDALRIDKGLERLHYSIKYLFTEVRRNQRIDKTVDSILQFIDVKLFERATNIERNKNKKIKNIVSGHRSSVFLNVKNIVEVGSSWYVSQLNKRNGDYRVDEVEPECNCDLQCEVCSVCIHRFTCTCPESVLKLNMCKHIHLVSKYIGSDASHQEILREQIAEEDSESMPQGYAGEIVIVDPDEIIIPDGFGDYNVKSEVLINDTHEIVEIQAPNKDLNEKKVKIASLSNEILESINSVDEGDAFLQILQAAKPTVASVRSDTEKTLYISTSDGTSEYHEAVPVKRVLYTAPPVDQPYSPEPNTFSTNTIEAHITLDSDGITLLSQAANIAR